VKIRDFLEKYFGQTVGRHWRALVNAVMNFGFHKMRGIS
jgi:hypothetical protein